MARGASKRQARGQTSTAPSTTTPVPPNTTSSSGPPSPFVPAPPSLQPFLSTLPRDHIYLTHFDCTPPTLKRRVFLVPCLLNVVISLGLCIRIYYAFPTYLQQVIAIFGYESPYKVDTSQESATSLVGTVADRTFLLLIDYALFALLGSWPREFLFGGRASRFAGPVEWRWTLGFRDTEVVVRRGRKWDVPLLVNKEREEEKERVWTGDEMIELKYKVGPAMMPSYLNKTGYLLLDKDFDLDFRGILDAYRLAEVDPPRLKLEEIDGLVFVCYGGQWLMWRPNAKPEEAEEDPKVENFKQKLMELKCQDIFYRWIEIVQFETNQSGGFTKAKQKGAMEELKRLLKAKRVDFETMLADVGGKEGVPGLDLNP